VGYAIRRIPEDEIQETLELFEQLLAHQSPDDLMATGVRAEIAGTGAGDDAGS
jgi:hypothetical protein